MQSSKTRTAIKACRNAIASKRGYERAFDKGVAARFRLYKRKEINNELNELTDELELKIAEEKEGP